jgi:hypothetical protein
MISGTVVGRNEESLLLQGTRGEAVASFSSGGDRLHVSNREVCAERSLSPGNGSLSHREDTGQHQLLLLPEHGMPLQHRTPL